MRFFIYDRDSSSEDLAKHDYLGSLETTLSKVLGARGGAFSGQLLNKAGTPCGKGKLIVLGSEVSQCSDILEFQFRASGLSRKNMMGLGTSDPFYVISRKQGSEISAPYVKVFESEVVKKNLNPIWRCHRLLSQSITNGDYSANLKFDVYDYEKSGKHKLIGCKIFFGPYDLVQPTIEYCFHRLHFQYRRSPEEDETCANQDKGQ